MARYNDDATLGEGLAAFGRGLAAWGPAIRAGRARDEEEAAKATFGRALSALQEAAAADDPGAPVLVGGAAGKGQLKQEHPFESPEAMQRFLLTQPNIGDMTFDRYKEFMALANHDNAPKLVPSDVKNFTPESIKAFQASGNRDITLLVPRESVESPFAKINPADYDPQSVAEYEQTGRPSSLRKRLEPPSLKTIPVSETHQQEFQYDQRNGVWNPVGSPRPIFSPAAPPDQFVGGPVEDDQGNYVLRDREGRPHVMTPQGPVPMDSAAGLGALKAPPKPLTEGQATARVRYNAGAGSLNTMSDLIGEGFEPGPGSAAGQTLREGIGALPWIGAAAAKIADPIIGQMQDERFRQFEAAQNSVIAQIIRAETGAGGGEGPAFVQSLNDRYRITQADTPKIAKQKLTAMRDYMATLRQAAGPGSGLTELKPLSFFGEGKMSKPKATGDWKSRIETEW